ncbi:MAG TPA: fibronectin type III domain-containing protein [Chitinophagales bacterium]|nr:fibronectin type III domain-containing protein [Chitinophagales bacterium]
MKAQVRSCGTMEHLQLLLQHDSTLTPRMDAIERFTQQWVASHPGGSNGRAVYTIPVVVHVVYNTASENISNEQIYSQLAVLNEDFRRMNADAANTLAPFQSVAADCELQFCLAVTDPNGNPTSGITRTYTPLTSFTYDDKVKFSSMGGKDAWAASRYLNLWVCDLNGIIGYAQFPGGQAATDGVVIDYQAFGRIGTAAFPFNLGRTATHEIGHWLNLRHIWGDGGCGIDDGVNDTPDHGAANYGCPLTQTSCNVLNMVQNYMDYTNDACMNLFTVGQKARIQSLFAAGGARYNLLSSNGCTATTQACGIPSSLGAANIQAASASLSWSAVSGAASYSGRIKPVSSSTWTTFTSTGTSYTATGLAQATQYEFQMKAVCSSMSSNYSSSCYFATISAAVTCGVPSGLSATNIQTTSATLNWNAVSGATGYSVRIKPVSSLSWTALTATGTSYNKTGLSPSTQYEFQVKAICGTASSNFSVSAYFTTALSIATCSDAYEPNESMSATASVSTSGSLQAQIRTATDVDWYRFGTQSTKKNIKITLNNLPADYSIELYDSRGIKIGQSQNTGTSTETIIYNNGYLGTYYLKVFGYNGAYNSSQCYNLQVQISGNLFRVTKGNFREAGQDDESAPLIIHPNPASEFVEVTISCASESMLNCSIADISGRIVFRNKMQAVAGENNFRINTSAFLPGIYFIRLDDGKITMAHRFLIE